MQEFPAASLLAQVKKQRGRLALGERGQWGVGGFRQLRVEAFDAISRVRQPIQPRSDCFV
jgi:hypothetical protein